MEEGEEWGRCLPDTQDRSERAPASCSGVAPGTESGRGIEHVATKSGKWLAELGSNERLPDYRQCPSTS